MSKIDKLSIQGVRSFGPFERQNIAFFTPLTLIVGYNGSGKTTIIECLKYATTGELPPNSKGGAFIHDPKLAGEREVLAQVKLRYHVPPSTSYVVTRSLQLSVKKAARSQKTLEGTLHSNCDGEKVSVSSKEANLNRLVSDTLGVSAAILDAVIFCHQEESFWPMSEPAALKKRFDEIFEAMKYTKAIENLKVLRKKQGEALTKLKTKEVDDKKDKDRGAECQARLLQLQQEIQDLNVQQLELKRQMDEADQEAKRRHEAAASFGAIVLELKNQTNQLELRQMSLEESKNRMDEELQESDEWLHNALEQHEERVGRYAQDLEENKSQYKEYKDSLDASRQELSEKLAEQGRHQSDKANYERQLEARVGLVQQAARLHSIRGFDGDLDDQKVQIFYDRIQKLLADKAHELDRLHVENASEIDNQTTAISELEARKSRYFQNREFAKRKIAACEKSIADLQRKWTTIEVDEGAKAILDSDAKDLEQRFQQASHELQNSDLDRKLQEEEAHQQQLEGESSRLSRELVESTRLVEDRAQLEVRKEELAEKNRRLTTLKSTWDQKLSTLVGEAWDPTTIDRQYTQGRQAKEQALGEASRERDDVVQQRKTIQMNLASIKEKGKKRDAEVARCKNAVLNALRSLKSDVELGVDALPEETERLEEDILAQKNDISLITEMGKYYRKCKKILDEKNKCELCERPFTNPSEKSRLETKMRLALDKYVKEELQQDLATNEQILDQLRAARPQRETYMRLLSEKKEADKELHEAQNREASTLGRLEEMDDIVRAKQEEVQEFESMRKIVDNISQTQKGIVEAETQVDRMTSQQQSSGTVRSTQEITAQQNECGEQLKAAKTKISQLTHDRQRMRDTVSSLSVERIELRHKLSHTVQQLERKKEYQDQIQAQKGDIAEQKQVIQEADKDLASVDPEISKAYAIRDDVLQKGREREKKVANEREGLAGSMSELKRTDDDIRDYLNRGGPSNLKFNEQAIRALEKTINRIDDDMNGLAAQTNKLKDDMANSDGKRKNIVENLNHRKASRDVGRLEKTIAELQSRRAHEDYDRLKAEAEELQSEYHLKNAERSTIAGQMKSKDNELSNQLKEWNTQYEYAAQRYRETHIKVETTKAAIEDLGRYSTALNNAIMQYHAMKMEEVNRIAAELWQSTYQGTDIDTILIRSDSEATGGRSSYNYRVCMVKQDTEMDMRGRCSAGQKVLASIIIRLALAESFGIGCGLIALDEPTTNLDSDNIKSLAQSLHSIIKARRTQSNFQLIVITHDEEFLRHMRCSEFCDDFWRVSRDEKQKSRIDRESIATIV
ncbi:AAA domain-containing protein [Nemania sp. FL0916]|nr:AAA domain-containing protein [Nemania sp. FL0916]